MHTHVHRCLTVKTTLIRNTDAMIAPPLAAFFFAMLLATYCAQLCVCVCVCWWWWRLRVPQCQLEVIKTKFNWENFCFAFVMSFVCKKHRRRSYMYLHSNGEKANMSTKCIIYDIMKSMYALFMFYRLIAAANYNNH